MKLVEQPVGTLASVDLGGAVAEHVPASISDTMPVGLLGLSFFNRFKYHVDPAKGIVTLRPNRLAEQGLIHGGRSEPEWRAEFQSLRFRIARLEARMERLSPAHTRRLATLEAESGRLEQQIEELEVEADRAQVPHRWRE